MKSILESRRMSILLLAGVVLGVYYPTLFAPLNSVDDPGLYTFLLNTDEISLRKIFFPSVNGTYYRPLLMASFIVDKYIWGLQESFMHLQNILLHLCNTLLVLAIACRASFLLRITSPVPSFLSALFFAVHPINTEAVNWISSRTDLLAGLFILISTYFLLRDDKRLLNIIITAICLFLACLSKETAVFFLPAAFLSPFFISHACREKLAVGETLRTNAVRFLCIFLSSASYFIVRAVAFSPGDHGVAQVITQIVGEKSAGYLSSTKIVLKAAGFYLKKLLFPFPLNFGIIQVSDFYVILGLMLIVTLFWVLVRRTVTAFFFLAATSIGSSALMISLIKVTWTPLAERYMYIPSAFFLLGVFFVLYEWKDRLAFFRCRSAVIFFLAILLSLTTVLRNLQWQDNLALFQDTVKKSPNFIPAKNQYAQALFAHGRQAEAIALIDSLEVPEHMVNFQYGMVNKAVARMHSGDYDGARKILRTTLGNPGKHEILILQRLLTLNEIEVEKGIVKKDAYYVENAELLTRLFQITGDPFMLYRLGQIHLFAGNREKALESFQQVVAKAPVKVYYYKPARKLIEKLSN